MINKPLELFLDMRDRQRIGIALAKGAAGAAARNIDLTSPLSWEFSGFSQNGEDGILDVLVNSLIESNRYFIEIGAADGIENNTSWLALVKRFRGIMVEGDSKLCLRAGRTLLRFSSGIDFKNIFVSKESVRGLRDSSSFSKPDVFSLDIDGVDYHIASEILNLGLRPKIFVVEYNAVFGPEKRLTVPYRNDFDYRKEDETQLYYGASISAWRSFFSSMGYHFVTVDASGVNAFFVDPCYFNLQFLESVKPLYFMENQYQSRKFGFDSGQQFELISSKKYVEI